jgi:spore maturation protein CgeB
MKYDYGKPAQGYSFEHENFYGTLAQMGYDTLYFDFMSIYQEVGREAMNRRLWETAKAEKPDLLFCFLFKEEIDRDVMRRITAETGIITLNWFADDHWKFDNYSRYWAPCFSWVVTTASSALPKYAAIGYQNVIKSQWGCNHYSYRKLNLPYQYDVTFVGKAHGIRRQVIHNLQGAGINVQTWGEGWKNGRAHQDEMIQIFNQSRININLANASKRGKSIEKPMRIIEKRSESLGRQIRRAVGLFYDPIPDSESDQRSQIKGRNFEIPGCGGFLLTDQADNLADYYDVGSEVACFDSQRDMIDKIRYYLAHEEERMEIAEAGYQRTLREHTYERRFREIFNKIEVG